jgi:pimeloyl-ACP methyl ester carboxylesterase
MDWQEGYVSAGGTRFFVRTLGEGPDLAVLLHGWPESGACWRRVAPALADSGWRVACPDLKGFGRSDSPRRGYDPRTLADETSRLVRNLHAGSAVLVGHDWGGAVAVATAIRHPGRVRALVLVNSPYRRLDLRHAWHVPLLNIPLLPEVLARRAPEKMVRAAIRHTATVREAFPAPIVREYAEAVRSGGWLGYYRTIPRRALGRAALGRIRRVAPLVDARPPSAKLRVPGLVIWGEHDPVLPLRLGEQAARDLGTDLEVIRDVGHFPQEEDPLAFTRVLLGFLGAGAGAAASEAADQTS